MRIRDLVNALIQPVQAFTAPPAYLRWGGAGGGGGTGPAGLAALLGGGQDQADLSASGGGGGGGGGPQGALLDQYIRKRAAVSFSIPMAGGGSANFLFEIETAYRLISPADPGVLVDQQG